MADMDVVPTKETKGLKASLGSNAARMCQRCHSGAMRSIEPGISRFPDVQLHIRGLVLTHHPGMTALASVDQLGNVQLFSSLVAAITSRSSLGPGTAGLEAKMSHWFLIWSAGSAVTAYISCIN